MGQQNQYISYGTAKPIHFLWDSKTNTFPMGQQNQYISYGTAKPIHFLWDSKTNTFPWDRWFSDTISRRGPADQMSSCNLPYCIRTPSKQHFCNDSNLLGGHDLALGRSQVAQSNSTTGDPDNHIHTCTHTHTPWVVDGCYLELCHSVFLQHFWQQGLHLTLVIVATLL